jgi:hypothetical protein
VRRPRDDGIGGRLATASTGPAPRPGLPYEREKAKLGIDR